MYGQLVVVYFITFICLVLSSSADVLHGGHNIYCNALPKVIAVEGEGIPYFVELRHCQGSIKGYAPDVKRCTENTWDDVTIHVTTPNGNREVRLKNHTSCKEQCVEHPQCPWNLFEINENTCGCGVCKHSKAPKGDECEVNYRWDNKKCKCVCSLTDEDAPSSKKILDAGQCKFVCKSPRPCPAGRTWDSDSCRCGKVPLVSGSTGDSDNTHQGSFLAAVIIGEFVFLYLIFDFLLYSKKTGLMYNVRRKCRGKSNADPDETQAKTNGVESNHMHGVVVDRNGRSQVTSVPLMHVSST